MLVLELLLKDHEDLAEKLVPRIAYNLITYVADFYRKEPKLEKAMQNLLSALEKKLNLLIDSILAMLDPNKDEQCTAVLKILDFYYSILAKGKPQFVQPDLLEHVITQILKCI